MTPLRQLLDLAGASLEAIGSALAEVPGYLNPSHESHRIAVTGLQRSGKTVFVTSFVHALLQAADAPVADFPFFPWRGQVRDVRVEDIPGIPPFPYRARLDELLADPPAWPARTTGLSGIRVHLRYTPTDTLTRMLFSTATVDLDLIDYPGEWLLDLPLLTQTYPEWSARMEELANAGSRAGLARTWLEAASGLDPDAREDPAALQRIGALYLDYLSRCRSERHLCFLQPGRFLGGGGDDAERGPIFFPLGTAQAARAGAKAGSNGAALVARYEAYRTLVRRFYGQVFGRLRRQVVLVDLLTALQDGPESFADMALATRSLTEAFEELKNPILQALSLGGVDRLALVATKADHVTADQMNNLVGLLRDMIGEPFVQANARQAGLFAAASLRATTQLMRKYRGEALPFLLGVPEGRGGEAIEVRPGVIPGQIPAAADWAALEFNIRRFAPPRLGTPYERPLPHINLDKILQFLIA